MSAREEILRHYASWTALSALRSEAPIKSKKDIYPLLREIRFAQVFDRSKGLVECEEFEAWHKESLETVIKEHPKLANQYGWAAKLVNVYLKTYAYVGDGGRDGLRDCLHPPIDASLWRGVKRKFTGRNDILNKSHAITRIASITSHDKYLVLIDGLREASHQLNCSLIEIEQLWEVAEDA
ncbi:MAG: hypothetical protein VX935_12235 [Pseudomonadota bacterium]|nr:hypothetical protein [Pseudomonadota bacterium]